MTLGPVSDHAWLVTLNMPAPIRIPIRAAYDSTVPRSRRRRETMGALRSLLINCAPSRHSTANQDSIPSRPSPLQLLVISPRRLTQAAPILKPGPSRYVHAPIYRHENARPR